MRVIDHERLRIALATSDDLNDHRDQIQELLIAWQSVPRLEKDIDKKEARIGELEEAIEDAMRCLDDVPAQYRLEAFEDAREAVDRARDALDI